MRKAILSLPIWATVHFRALLLLLLLCSAFNYSSRAQCFATSTLNGTAAVNDASIGSVDFDNEGNSLASDDNTASASALIALFTGNTNYLKVTGFGFNIPSYASICGVVVEIEKRAGGLAIGAWIRDNDIRIVKANAVAGVDGGDDATDWSGTESWFSYGAANGMWGTTLTPAEVNSPNFGVAISARIRGLAVVFPTVHIDNIRVTVYYNPILPVKLLSFNSSIKNNLVRLDWETADESDHETIIVQRARGGSLEWTDLSTYQLQSNNQRKLYSYTDPLDKTGHYQYRLKISGNDHQPTYSPVKMVEYRVAGEPVLYPNPASNQLFLQNLDDTRNIVLTNLAQQQLRVPVQVTGERSARVDISRLPRGIYFISAAGRMLKFFKE